MEVVSYQTHIEIIIFALLFLMFGAFMKRDKPRRVWIIEDNEFDTHLLKTNLDVDDIAVTYLNSAEEFRTRILRPWRYPKPDQVLVDFHLERNIKGTQITGLCETNGIDCLLMTGDDREILGISEEKILRKSATDEFYNKISTWMHKGIA